MSERYTKRDAVKAFERLAEATGATIADPSWKISDKRRLGAWTLDYNGVYGGYVVNAYVADSPPREGDDRPQAYTAITCPLGYERRTAREFCEHVNSVTRAMDYAKSV
jgi:hypothetical protein